MNEETMNDQARRLLRPLAGEPAEPSRVDAARAMADGRRRRRHRWWATGSAVAALTVTSVTGGTLAVAALNRPAPVLLPLPTVSATPPAPASASASASARPAAPERCTVTRLPTDGVDKAVVTGGDPSGRWLAGRLYTGRAGFSYPLVLWKDGRIAARPEMPGGDPTLVDVNRSGTAVGWGFPGEEPQPYVYSGGRMRKLPGGAGTAHALNDAGVVVGGLEKDVVSRAARWPSPAAAPERLPVPDGTRDSVAVDVDEDGTIVGTVSNPALSREKTGYLWLPDGTATTMPMPEIDGVRATFFWPESVRGGWVAGRAGISTPDSTSFAPFRYRVATGTYERLPDDAGMPDRVAANGWVLSTGRGVFLVAGAGATELPAYRGGTDYQMVSLSDDGLVAGGHLIADGRNQPLMWRCRLSR